MNFELFPYKKERIKVQGLLNRLIKFVNSQKRSMDIYIQISDENSKTKIKLTNKRTKIIIVGDNQD